MEGNSKSRKILVVAGAGAAGFFCAVNAARLHPNLEVIIVEKTNKILSKVKVSGGGRCNLTHACFDIDEMSRRYPRGGQFVRKAFHQFFTSDTIQWFEERGVKLKTEADGRMFPVSNFSQSIIDCLLKEADQYKVQVWLQHELRSIREDDGRFHLVFGNGRIVDADYLCIACGGYPKDEMFNWIRQTGHTIETPVPSLFTFNLPGHDIVNLMGVVVENAQVKIQGSKLQQNGPVLITHWGLSGPAILRLSAWAARELAAMNWHFNIIINWIPEYNEQSLKTLLQRWRTEKGGQKILNKNELGLPNRLWEFLTGKAGIDISTRWADLSAKSQQLLIANLCTYHLEIKGKTTFKEEFVTAGGVRLSEINPNTMMSKKLKNLFFSGEILDVDGITGGFNFQHAWTSGFIAAKNLGQID